MSLLFHQTNDQLPEGVRLPVPPPAGFNPLKASNEDLIKHGLPPKPTRDESPESFVWWEKLCSSAGSYVTPGFMPLPARESKVDPDTGDEIHHGWSGAVIDASKDYKFNSVRGSWTVSRPHPDNWAWQERYWESGHFAAGTWVGMDGSKAPHGQGSRDVLQAGIGHRCVVSTHQDTGYSIHPWWEWYPEHPWTITGFQVATGDLVGVNITASSSTEARIVFVNFSACTYTSFDVTAPRNVELKGNCAEWIVEAHPSDDGRPAMSYLGATFFFNCGATEVATTQDSLSWLGGSKCRDLRGARFLEVKQGGQVLSVASHELSNDVVLGVVAERRVHKTDITYVPPPRQQ
ncbi:concanavalin A-like lectin/glucanase [Xylariaceae sp. FL0255]|nr:concanavalin A-like lectin/glucanase [Xylariaceae sp. FL0255]